jgi:hypothetical protein
MTSAVDVVLQSGAKAVIGHLKGKCIYPMNYFVLIIFFLPFDIFTTACDTS